jgi:hypothetical protein
MVTGMPWFLFSTNRSSDCPTQGSSEYRTIATAELVTNCCASGATNATANSRIQGGIIRVRFNNH